jgi:hypothetical protein
MEADQYGDGAGDPLAPRRVRYRCRRREDHASSAIARLLQRAAVPVIDTWLTKVVFPADPMLGATRINLLDHRPSGRPLRWEVEMEQASASRLAEWQARPRQGETTAQREHRQARLKSTRARLEDLERLSATTVVLPATAPTVQEVVEAVQDGCWRPDLLRLAYGALGVALVYDHDARQLGLTLARHEAVLAVPQ